MPRRPVLVGGADAAAGGADLFLPALGFTGDIDPLMVRHDDMEGLGEEQRGVVRNPPRGLEVGDLPDEDLWVENDAVADNAPFPRVQNPRRDKMEDHLLVAHDEGVPRVVAPLIADHVVCELGIDIDDLAFSLVAPLGAYHDNVCHYHLLTKHNLTIF